MIGATMKIDGVEIIRVGYVTTWLGNLIGILMVYEPLCPCIRSRGLYR